KLTINRNPIFESNDKAKFRKVKRELSIKNDLNLSFGEGESAKTILGIVPTSPRIVLIYSARKMELKREKLKLQNLVAGPPQPQVTDAATGAQSSSGFTSVYIGHFWQLVKRSVCLSNQCLIILNFLNVQMPPRREPDHPAPTQATVVAQFRDYHAEKFSGQGDPRIVDEWIQGLEFIFEVMECPERYRVVCAQLQLTGDARLWWNAYWSMRPGEKVGCTWEMFKELIREKYYPTYYRAEMERQFLSLQQGIRTVDEYEREFTRLAAFAPDLVCTEAQRAQRFIDMLYPAFRHNIVGHGTQTYARA
ncbi:Unknown protein, partial [Striga hermonthica]